MKTCDKPEWRECPDAIDIREGQPVFELPMFLGAIECYAEGPCPFEEEDE